MIAGKLVFSSDDLSFKWDGQDNAEDAYTYVINAVEWSGNQSAQVRHGDDHSLIDWQNFKKAGFARFDFCTGLVTWDETFSKSATGLRESIHLELLASKRTFKRSQNFGV